MTPPKFGGCSGARVGHAVAGGEPRNGTDPQRCGFVPVSIACRQQPAAVRDTMPTDEYDQRM